MKLSLVRCCFTYLMQQENLIFTITNDGLLFVVDKISGNIIRVTNIYNQLSKRKIKKIKPTGFVLDLNKIYLTRYFQ